MSLGLVMTFVGDVHVLINYIGFAQWSQRGITMLVLFWIRYKSLEPKSVKPIRSPLIVPIIFFLICLALVSDISERVGIRKFRQ